MKLFEPAFKDEVNTNNREGRRQRSSIRYTQFRDIHNGAKRMWEWRPTQVHPKKKRECNRRRNRAARASRKANR